METICSVSFQSKLNRLSGSLCLAQNPAGGVLFVAGGGAYTKELYREWQHHLAHEGYSSFAFDFPGIGESEGKLSSTSLNTRLADTGRAFDIFIDRASLSPEQVFLCGRSMGGPIALRLALQKRLKKVILLYPAAYAEAAYDKLFGPQFSEVIRKENSWVDSPDFLFAEQFEGKMLVIYGEFDAIIPKEIQNKYLGIAKSKGEALVLQGVGHNQYLWESDSKNLANRKMLFNRTIDFLSS